MPAVPKDPVRGVELEVPSDVPLPRDEIEEGGEEVLPAELKVGAGDMEEPEEEASELEVQVPAGEMEPGKEASELPPEAEPEVPPHQMAEPPKADGRPQAENERETHVRPKVFRSARVNFLLDLLYHIASCMCVFTASRCLASRLLSGFDKAGAA